jgi:hypothetical protein
VRHSAVPSLSVAGKAAWRFPIVRASNEGSPRPRVARAQGITRPSVLPSFSPSVLGGSGQGCLLLRASNEHILIVRVLRAKRATGRSLLLSYDPGPDSGSCVTATMASLRISTIRLSSGSDVLSGGMRTITLPMGRNKSPRLRASIATRCPTRASRR